MKLVIVESPTKTKTIGKYLEDDFEVAATRGHIRDLPPERFGVDLESFEPEYTTVQGKEKVVEELKKEGDSAEDIILASVDYQEPILVLDADNRIRQVKVGPFIDNLLEKNIDLSLFKVPAFDFKTREISFRPIREVSRHPIGEDLLEITLDYSRRLKVTASHSVFTENREGQIKAVAGKDLRVGDKILAPSRLPRKTKGVEEVDLLKQIYNHRSLREKVFIKAQKVNRHRRERDSIPGRLQFQPELIFSSQPGKIPEAERERREWGQSLLAKIGSSRSAVRSRERRNPLLSSGKKHSEAPAFKKGPESQRPGFPESSTPSWQPLSRFSWQEIEENFKDEAELKISGPNHSPSMPRFFPVDKDLMLFLGFFIAGGEYTENAVRFSFGEKRGEDDIEKVKQVSQRMFDLSASDLEGGTSNSILLTSGLVSFFLKKVLKIRAPARRKKVPWIVFNAPPSLQFAFLEALFSEGRGPNLAFETVSPELAQGIRFLLLQNGLLTSHSVRRRPNRRPIHSVLIPGKTRLREIKKIRKDSLEAKTPRKRPKNGGDEKNLPSAENPNKDLGLLKIKSIKRIEASKDFVYDFSVKGENFICGDGGVCAHNTDPDREGEAIAWHVKKALGLEQDYQRIVFHEITERALKKALEEPEKIDLNLVNAQKARRILDRLVGYKLSPLLWKKVAKGLSAGRVQSVTLRLICEREAEIEEFEATEYWTLHARLKKEGRVFEAKLKERKGEKLSKYAVKTESEAEKMAEKAEKGDFRVKEVEKKKRKRNPYPPFTTSSLQQDAWYKLRFSSKYTIYLAQRLYEKGFITYHRTDSLNLSSLATRKAEEVVKEDFGPDYWPGGPRRFKTKSKAAQEAHEAIRPTDPEKRPREAKSKLKKNQARLYRLIWSRFLASQMSPALFEKEKAEIKSGEYLFQARGQTLKFPGFLSAYEARYKESELPDLEPGEILDLEEIKEKQHFTRPPSRYTEATLIKEMKRNGIGRPSTYAPTVSLIQDRNYARKNSKKRFYPTELGKTVNDLLVEHFADIVDIDFTAEMEKDLDEIAEGERDWQKVLREFYTPFEKNLEKKYEEIEKKVEQTDKECPECGSPLLVRMSKFGPFYGCSDFPDCKYTREIQKKLGISCPACGEGELIQKRTKKGKVFYGCNRWPDCEFALWNKPTGEKCPRCGSLLTSTKKGEKCSSEECDFKK